MTFRFRYPAVLLTAVLCYAALGAVLGVLPDYVRSLGGGPVLVGLAVGAPALTGAAGRPLGGRLADRSGPAPIMIAGALVMALGTLPAFVDALPALLVSRLLVGAGEASMMAAAVLWLLRLAGPERRGRAMGHIGLANYAGLTVGPLLAHALAGPAHPAPVWIAAALLPLLAAALARVLARGEERSADGEEGGGRRVVGEGGGRRVVGEGSGRRVVVEAGSGSAAGEDGGASETAPVPEREEPPQPAAWRVTIRPGIGLMLVNFGYVAILSFGAAAAVEQGTGIGTLVIPVFGVGVIASRTILAGVPDRFGAARTLIVAVVLEAGGLAATAIATSPPAALVSLVVMAAGQGLAVPSLGLLALAAVPASRHGRTAGAFFAYFDAGVGLGGPAVGLAARAADPAGGLLAAAGAVLATAPVALLGRGKRPVRSRSRRMESCRDAT